MAEETQHIVAESGNGSGGKGQQDATILRIDDVMSQLSLSRAQVYRLVKDGILKASKSDASLEILESDVAAAADNLAAQRETVEWWLRLFAERLAEWGIVDLPDIDLEEVGSGVEEMVSRLLLDCMAAKSSDFYLMPAVSGDRLLVRNQGQLQEIGRVESDFGNLLRVELKALAPLPEEAIGQQSESIFSHTADQHSAQVRLSVLSTPTGEHIHLQFFYTGVEQTLEEIGYTSRQREELHRLLAGKPGLLLLAGSHDRIMQEQRAALANHLSTSGKLIVAIDRRLNFQSGYTIHIEDRGADGSFDADPWQTAMRLCPDVLMLNAVRDSADIEALVAAISAGIMVIAEVPCATSVAAVERLAGLGLGQREMSRHFLAASEFCLIPGLCPACRTSRLVNAKEAKHLRVPASTQLWEAAGCVHCEGGYRGNRPVWGMLLGNDVDFLDPCEDSVMQPPMVEELFSSDVSLTVALRSAALAGDATLEHISPMLR